jgi:hypothetical protein
MGGTFKWEIHKNVKKNKIGRLCWEICEKKKNCPTLLHSPLSLTIDNEGFDQNSSKSYDPFGQHLYDLWTRLKKKE